jgi:hypothetical protein
MQRIFSIIAVKKIKPSYKIWEMGVNAYVCFEQNFLLVV